MLIQIKRGLDEPAHLIIKKKAWLAHPAFFFIIIMLKG